MFYPTCSIDNFVDHRPFGCNLKGIFFDPPVWEIMGDVRFGDRHIRSSAHGFLLALIGTYGLSYLFSYLVGSKGISVSSPARTNMALITALEAIVR